MSIGKRIKELREAKGFTQDKLAKLIGVTKSAVGNYELDLSGPKETVLYKLIEVLECDANYLFQDGISVTKKEFNISPCEQEHITKYRSLEDFDKKTIDVLLDTLSKREKQSLKEIPHETEHAYLVEDNRLYMTQYDYGVSAGIGNFLDEWDVPKTTVQIADSPTARKADYILKVDGDSMMPKFEDGDRVFVKAQETVEMNEIGIFVIDGTCFLKQFKGNRLHSLNPTYDDIALNEFQNIKCVGKVLGKV